MERTAIALLCALFGFATGMFGWFCLSGVPPFDWGIGAWFRLSLLLGLTSFVIGYWRPEEAVNWLGGLAKLISHISTNILSWIRMWR